MVSLRSSGDQLSTSRPQQTRPAGHTGPALSQQSGVSSHPGQGPWLQWQPQTLVSLQVFRRPAKHLQTTADSRLGASGYFRSSQSLATLGQPGSTRSRPLIAAYTGQVTDRSPTQPRNCGQSPVLRRPAKHLQTTADFRLGRQVTLAQPSASS